MHADTLKFYKYTPIKKQGYQGKFCQVPFDTIQIDNDGDVQLCDCQYHMPYTIGNVFQTPLQEIWLNSQAQAVRQAVIDSDFTYCSWACPKLNDLVPTPAIIPEVKSFPKIIKFDLDISCNLKCPSCRETVIIEKNSYRIQKQIELFEEIKQWALANPAQIVIIIPMSSGDVFASHSGLKFLESLINYPHNNLKLHITTNGTLIEKNKDTIDKIKHLVASWSVSIDAATPGTYKQVRGGNWEKLMLGLDYVSSLGKNLKFNFVVQKNNWHEIGTFAELANKYNASIYYSNLVDWGHWTIQWWHDNSVLDRTKDQYRLVLNSLQEVKTKYKHRVYFSAAIENNLKKIGQ